MGLRARMIYMGTRRGRILVVVVVAGVSRDV